MLTDEASRKDTQHRLSEDAVLRLVPPCTPQHVLKSPSYTCLHDDHEKQVARKAA
jgi:hypothetical protein